MIPTNVQVSDPNAHWDNPKIGVSVPGAVTHGSGTSHCLGWGLKPAVTFSMCPLDVAVLTLHHNSSICAQPGELTKVWSFSSSGRVTGGDTFLIKIKTQVRDRCVSSTVMWGYTHDTQVSYISFFYSSYLSHPCPFPVILVTFQPALCYIRLFFFLFF